MRLFALIFLGLQSGLLTAPAAWAQAESHLNDPDQAPLPKNITALLDSRRNALKGSSADQLRDKLAQINKDLTGKAIDSKRMNELLEKYPYLKDPQTVANLRETLQSLQGQYAPNDSVKLQDLLKTLDIKNTHGARPRTPANSTAPPLKSTPPSAQNADSSFDPPNRVGNEGVKQLARMFERNFGDAPLSQDLLKDITKALSEGGQGDGKENILESIQKELKLMTVPGKSESSINWGEMRWFV